MIITNIIRLQRASIGVSCPNDIIYKQVDFYAREPTRMQFMVKCDIWQIWTIIKDRIYDRY